MRQAPSTRGRLDPFALPLRLGMLSVARPRLTLAAMVAVVALAAPGLLRLELRTDGQALVPQRDPAVLVDAEVRRQFGLLDPVVVLVTAHHEQGIFNRRTLELVRGLSDDMERLPRVEPSQVTSLATERSDRVRPGTMDFRPYLDGPLDTPQSVALLRADVRANDLLTGTLVSADGRSTAILVGMPRGADSGGRLSVCREIERAVERRAASGHDVIVVGAPVAEALLGLHILQDLALLLPLAVLMIAAVIGLGCRRWRGVALALGEVGASLIVTVGVMGWLGVPVYLTTAVLPVVLTTIGLADEIHFFWHYQRVLAGGPSLSARRALVRTLRRIVRPVVLTSLTTAVGLGSFALSPVAPVRAFGLFAALGTLFCLVWTLTAVPAALALIPARRMTRPRPARRLTPVVVERLVMRPAWVAGGLLALTAVALAGLPRLQVQDGWIRGFAPDSPFRRDVAHANAQLHGVHRLLVHLRFDGDAVRPAGGTAGTPPLHRSEVLESIGDLERFIGSRPEAAGVLGPHRSLATVRSLWNGRTEAARALPGDPRAVAELLAIFERGAGVHRRREMIDDARRRAVVTVFLEDANYRDTRRLMESIRRHVDGELATLGAAVEFAGDVAVSQATIPVLVRTQLASLGLALLAATLLVRGLCGSWRTGWLAVLPASIAIVWILGSMGWLGVPLGIASSMFCAVAVGVGVDGAIHLLEGVRRARAAGSPAPAATALEEVSPAIVVDSLAISSGFGVLMLSRVPANALLGLLVTLALAATSVLSLGGLGSLMATAGNRRRRSPGRSARPLVFARRTRKRVAPLVPATVEERPTPTPKEVPCVVGSRSR